MKYKGWIVIILRRYSEKGALTDIQIAQDFARVLRPDKAIINGIKR